MHSENKIPSCNWIYWFFKCHSNIVLSISHGLDLKCAKAFNCLIVNCFFDRLFKIVKYLEILVENIYNMDEKGC